MTFSPAISASKASFCHGSSESTMLSCSAGGFNFISSEISRQFSIEFFVSSTALRKSLSSFTFSSTSLLLLKD